MFKSAVVKLTAWYVAVLCVVCLLFSVPTYTIASARLRRGAERQSEVIRRAPIGIPVTNFLDDLEMQREAQLGEDRSQLMHWLLYFNLFIIVSGTFASYWFARWTLEPIEDAHQAQARFTADASHQLRTPLATMRTEIDVALRDKGLTAKQARDILTSNLEEIQRLQSLSEQLLGLTRLQKIQSLKIINLSTFIREQVGLLQKEFGVSIAYKAPKRLEVLADKALLGEVLRILVANATAYNDKPKAEVTVSLQAKKDNAAILLTDNGPGIPVNDRSHIFDRFYRGKNADRQSGHGLGLAVAQQIIEAHNGSILLHASTPKGTTFKITLPRS